MSADHFEKVSRRLIQPYQSVDELYPPSHQAFFFYAPCLLGSTYLLVDPCEREERVMDGLLMIAMNKHREICSIQSSGGIMLLKEQVRGAQTVLRRCLRFAAIKIGDLKNDLWMSNRASQLSIFAWAAALKKTPTG